MDKPPDDFNIPDDAMPPDDDDDGAGDENLSDDSDDSDGKGLGNQIHGPVGVPPKGKRRKVKIVMSASSQEVKFADMFGFTLSPTHGIVKFGVFQPETGEFVVHTQVAMTPQGIVALSQSLKKNLDKTRRMKPGRGQSMN